MKNVRKRSPASPSYSLEEALTKVFQIYEASRHRAMSIDTAAKAMGHMKAHNGVVSKSLATLKMFGLLESRGIGMVAVTKSFQRYQLESNKQNRQKWLVQFINKPKIFAIILSAYPDRLPSDETLKHLLVAESGFMEARAESVIRCFRRSVAFAGVYAMTIDQAVKPKVRAVRDPEASRSESQAVQEAVFKASNLVLPIPQMPDTYDAPIPVRLTGGRKAWIVLPNPFFNGDKDMLSAQVKLFYADDVDEDVSA